MAFKHNDLCLAKVAGDEPIFVLRAQDRIAPILVRIWREMAISLGDMRATNPKLFESSDLADQMEDWQAKNPDKTKWPD